MQNKSISDQLRSSIIISSIVRYTDIFLYLVFTIILSRILTPNDFGILVSVTIFIFIFKLIGISLEPSIIQDKEMTENDNSSLFNFTIIIGFLLGILIFFLAPLIAKYLNDSIYINIFRIFALDLLFHTFAIVPKAIMIKRKQFLQTGVISISANFISGSAAIYMAIKGYGYYALIVRVLIKSILEFLFLLNFSRIKIKATLQLKSFFNNLSYTLFQLASNFIHYFSTNLDKLFISKYWGEASLGYYEKATRFALLPLQFINESINPVLHPVISDLQNKNKDIFYIYNKIYKLQSLLGFPVSIIIFFCSQEIILIILGYQWFQTIVLFKILSLSIGFQMIRSTASPIFQSTGRTDLLLYSGIINVFILTISIIGGIIFNSIEIFSLFLLFSYILSFIQTQIILIKAALKEHIMNFLSLLINPLLITALLAVFLRIQEVFFNINNLLISLSLKLLLSASVFLLGIYITGEYKFLKHIFSKKKTIS